MLVALATCGEASFASDAPSRPGATGPADQTNGPVDETTGPVEVAGWGEAGEWPLALTPPKLIRDPGTGSPAGYAHHLLGPRGEPPRPRLVQPDPVLVSLDITLRYLRLMVTGDHRPGLSPFLGTSAAALGGLRLRF
jgi:hypothetical protein